MKIAVVVHGQGHPDVVDRLLSHLEGQDRLPDRVLVWAAAEGQRPSVKPSRYPVAFITGAASLATPRFTETELGLDGCDIVTFFDEGFVPASGYLERLAAFFETFPDVAAVTGHVSAYGSGLTFDEGLMLLSALEKSVVLPNDAVGLNDAFAGNVSIRAPLMSSLQQGDARALWRIQDQFGLAARLRQFGRVVRVPSLLGVQLKAGVEQRTWFGSSRTVRPAGRTSRGPLTVGHAIRLITGNVSRGLLPKTNVDGPGRLKGNLVGAYHLLRGRVEPEHMLKR